MKPVNRKEIYRSLFKFVLQFSMLLFFSLVCGFFFIKASDKEYVLLKERNDEIEEFISTRNEINQQFSLINKNFKELGVYSNSLSDLTRKRILQTEIAKSAGVINDMISKVQSKKDRPSLELYHKMNLEVSTISRLQDSLFTTKNLIESKRIQLNNCLEVNKVAEVQIRRGALRSR